MTLRGWGWRTAGLLISLLVALPVLFIVAALWGGDDDGVWAHLVDTVLARYVLTSLGLVLGVLALALLVGVGCAWLTSRYVFPGVRIWRWALVLPLALPTYVLAYCWTDCLEFSGPVQTALREAGWITRLPAWWPSARSLPSAWVVLAVGLYPYIYLVMRGAFLVEGDRLWEAARSLGHGPVRAWFTGMLPALRGSLAAGAALVGLETLAEWGAVDHFGLDVFTTGIYRTWLGLYDYHAACRLAALLLLGVAVVLGLEYLSRGRGRTLVRSDAPPPRPRLLRGWRAWLATACCLLPVLVGCVLPAARLGWLVAADSGLAERGGAILAAAGTSALLALLAALLIVAAALLASYGKRLAGGRLLTGSVAVARLGYAIPGSVLAVAIIVPFAGFDNRVLMPTWAWLTGETWRLPLTGSMAILLYAYLVRFLAVGLAPVDASLQRLPRRLDEAARSLGARPAGVFGRVHLPLLGRGTLIALLLVAVEVLKELPATMILQPFGIDTLAVRLHQQVAQESLEGAAAPALLLVAIGSVPMILVARQAIRGDIRRRTEGTSA